MTDHPPRRDKIDALLSSVSPALALLAAMQLDLFTGLAPGRQSAVQLGERLSLPAERLSRLLYALAAAGLLTEEAGAFSNTPETAAFLTKGSPHYMGASHELLSDLWHADLRTAQSIEDGRPAAPHDFDDMDHVALSAFLRGLVPSALSVGRELSGILEVGEGASFVDIGGGSGAALVGLVETRPAARAVVFELPSVVAAARPIIDEFGHAGRISFEEGDITRETPKGEHDVALLRAMLQVLSPEQAQVAVNHVFQCLKPGGTILITGGGILHNDRKTPTSGVYLNLTLMNLYESGRSYTLGEHYEWLKHAGFIDSRARPLASGSLLISATKPHGLPVHHRANSFQS
ncbi:O-methyltransferase, family 2 [plant metagenome]|uniref:O-methyltransferase, family 2 n=1 Tax=plant metagenome TaxID=1297885 RepID=A0A484SGR5_9ZZZZ